MDIKHKSKLQKGFEKQHLRQYNKPREVRIDLPTAIELPAKFKGEYEHYIIVENSIWNGMNLVKLANSFNRNRVGGMYGTFTIDSNGKYKLSIYGKKVFKNKLKKHKQS